MKRFTVILLLFSLLLGLSACVTSIAQPSTERPDRSETEPTPQPTPEPTQEPTLEPTPEPTPAPTEPEPEPEAERYNYYEPSLDIACRLNEYSWHIVTPEEIEAVGSIAADTLDDETLKEMLENGVSLVDFMAIHSYGYSLSAAHQLIPPLYAGLTDEAILRQMAQNMKLLYDELGIEVKTVQREFAGIERTCILLSSDSSDTPYVAVQYFIRKDRMLYCYDITASDLDTIGALETLFFKPSKAEPRQIYTSDVVFMQTSNWFEGEAVPTWDEIALELDSGDDSMVSLWITVDNDVIYISVMPGTYSRGGNDVINVRDVLFSTKGSIERFLADAEIPLISSEQQYFSFLGIECSGIRTLYDYEEIPFVRYDILYYHDKCWYIYSFLGTDEALLQSCLSMFVRQEN